jgi:hypothetical protein
MPDRSHNATDASLQVGDVELTPMSTVAAKVTKIAASTRKLRKHTPETAGCRLAQDAGPKNGQTRTTSPLGANHAVGRVEAGGVG